MQKTTTSPTTWPQKLADCRCQSIAIVVQKPFRRRRRRPHSRALFIARLLELLVGSFHAAFKTERRERGKGERDVNTASWDGREGAREPSTYLFLLLLFAHGRKTISRVGQTGRGRGGGRRNEDKAFSQPYNQLMRWSWFYPWTLACFCTLA